MTITKWGAEFLVNTVVTGNQWESSVYALAGGGFAVTWTDQASGGADVRFQRYAADGTALGAAPLLPASFLFTSDPVIAGLEDGRFVVAYSPSITPFSATPRAVLYNEDGAFNQTLFQLDQNGDQDTMSIVALNLGGVAISWVDHNTGAASDVRFRVFDSNYAGSSIINVQASDNGQDDPSMAVLTNGRFVVTWSEYDGTLDSSFIRAQIFNANGTSAVAGFDVVAPTENDQGYSSVTGLTGGGFVVTWWDAGELQGQVYDANGATVGSRFSVDADGHNPSVAALINGGFVIVFNTYDGTLGDDEQSAVHGQEFNASGAKVGAEFLVNTTTTGDQSDAHVAGLPDGRFVVTWTDTSQTGADTSGMAVRGQIFDPRTSAVTLAGSPLADDFIGTSFSDSLSGAEGADRLDGRAGNDTLNGDAGVDFAGYTGASTAASFARTPSGAWTITADGTDTLTGIEYLQFTDRTLALRPADGSLDGGTSDIILRNASSGVLATWQLAGATVTTASVVAITDPTYAAVASGDFNGDGRTDVLFRNAAGILAEWQFDGAAVTGVGAWVSDPAWALAGVGDFNGDHRDDILWRHSSGLLAQWQMDGFDVIGVGVFAASDPAWALAAVADFNGDGHDDFLWRHSSGALAQWSLDGFAATNLGVFAISDTAWQVVGTGDFNGDLREDIMWRHSSGVMALWHMDGTTVTSVGTFAVSDTAWNVSDIGDYNGDGRDDILWQGPDGTFAVWAMDGFNVLGAGIVGNPGAGWGDI